MGPKGVALPESGLTGVLVTRVLEGGRGNELMLICVRSCLFDLAGAGVLLSLSEATRVVEDFFDLSVVDTAGFRIVRFCGVCRGG